MHTRHGRRQARTLQNKGRGSKHKATLPNSLLREAAGLSICPISAHGVVLARLANDEPRPQRYKDNMQDPNRISLEHGWAVLLHDLKISPANVLRRAGLPTDLNPAGGFKISVDEYFQLWEGIEAEANEPTLAIRIAEALTPEAFQPTVFAALCSSTLRQAVYRLSQYKRLCAPMEIPIEESAESLDLGWRWLEPGRVSPRALALAELTFMTQLARMGTRSRIVPASVRVPPGTTHLEAFEAFFGVRPSICQDHGLSFYAQDADRPFLTANPGLWNVFEPELRRRLSELEAGASLEEKIRGVLLESLPSGEGSIRNVSKRLGMSSRTLQRQLKAEGLNFRDIVRATRESLSRHYLKNTNLSYPEIAFLIGFDEPSSFFRAFRKWTGMTPETVRAAV